MNVFAWIAKRWRCWRLDLCPTCGNDLNFTFSMMDSYGYCAPCRERRVAKWNRKRDKAKSMYFGDTK
jgi:hypothetical protein